ncbi:hypothetical protein GSI_12207 [Ganoderma sinense ZZ0214-1]|uniref:Uncharacterized protein n=1 Tax=Ganoderma sinense ZZ0214-1 TaxID=1077348 RepID=A0A2G8RY52_9APHY|nr:hypothetical protein GSI_12207 [Ganoderma sinense ZZ0214-1]
MPSYVVIGASRGIGLEFVRQLACRSNTIVFAIVRNPQGSTHLDAAIGHLENVYILSGDVADYGTLERAAKQVSDITGGGLDYLIHNAAKLDMSVFNGFDDYSSMEDMDNDFISAFRVHSLGPIHGITAFLPLLRIRASHTKKVIVIGSCAGDPKTVLAYNIASMVAYGMTKATAHIATTKFAIKLKEEGFVVVTLDPGMVNTTATAPPIQLDALEEVLENFKETEIQIETQGQRPEDSVAAQLRVIDGLEVAHNGLYLSHLGGEYHAPS